MTKQLVEVPVGGAARPVEDMAVSFARSWALDLKGTGICVNVLSPRGTDTPGLSALAPGAEENRPFMETSAGAIPLGRIGMPEELAAGGRMAQV